MVGDLPQVEADVSLQQQQGQARHKYPVVESALNQAELTRAGAAKEYEAERASFDNWLATRRATGRADQDSGLQASTASLDALKAAESAATRASAAKRQKLLEAQQAEAQPDTSAGRIWPLIRHWRACRKVCVPAANGRRI